MVSYIEFKVEPFTTSKHTYPLHYFLIPSFSHFLILSLNCFVKLLKVYSKNQKFLGYLSYTSILGQNTAVHNSFSLHQIYVNKVWKIILSGFPLLYSVLWKSGTLKGVYFLVLLSDVLHWIKQKKISEHKSYFYKPFTCWKIIFDPSRLVLDFFSFLQEIPKFFCWGVHLMMMWTEGLH